MKRVLLTGANGMLGSSIFQSFRDKFEMIPIQRDSLNILDYKAVKKFIKEVKPELVIHTAAYTNVEKAEAEPEACFQTNYTGTLNLVNAIKGFDSKFIYISSTGCYGTQKDVPYTEYDAVVPTTVYHKSKIAGENAVKDLCDDFLILRMGWLYGGMLGHKKNFVYNRYKEAKQTDKIISDPFQYGNPTSVEDVALQIELLIRQNVIGIYNVVADGYCSRFEYVNFIVEDFGLDCIVEKADKPFQRVAPVSANESAINFNLRSMGLDIMNDWKTSLSAYIDKLKSEILIKP